MLDIGRYTVRVERHELPQLIDRALVAIEDYDNNGDTSGLGVVETTLTAVRGELANAASTYDSKIERLEATCTSLEHEKKEAADEHADAVARVSATLTRQAEEAAAKVAKERAAEVARLVDRYDTSSRKWEANTKSLQDEYEHRLAYVVV